MRVDGAIKGLMNGISTKPYQIQEPGFASHILNMRPDQHSGLIRREPANVTPTGIIPEMDRVRWYKFNYEKEYYYLFLYQLDATTIYPAIFTEAGTQVDVRVEAGHGYMSEGNIQDLVFTTYRDEVYIANPAVEVEVVATNSSLRMNTTYIVVNEALQPGGKIEVKFQQFSDPRPEFEASLENPSTALDIIGVNDVAVQLAEAMNAKINEGVDPGDEVDYWFALDNVIYQNGTPYFINELSGATPTQVWEIGEDKIVDDINKLPYSAAQHDTIEISPNGVYDGKSSFYMTARGEVVEGLPNSVSSGVRWEEVTAPEPRDLDQEVYFNHNAPVKSTMPLHMVYDAEESEFVIKEVDYDFREAGNDRNNEYPLNGQQITTMNVIQGRLAYICKDTAVLSQTDEVTNFWRQTMTQQLADDPVSVSSTDAEGDTMTYSIGQNNEILLFSRTAQYVLRGDSITPQTLPTMSRQSSYPMNLEADPVSTGVDIYYSFPYGTTSGVARYTVSERRDSISESFPITNEVEQLIQGTVTDIAVDPHTGVSVYVTDSPDSLIYVADQGRDRDGRETFHWSSHEFTGFTVHEVDVREGTIVAFATLDATGELVFANVSIKPPTTTEAKYFLDGEVEIDGVDYDIVLPDIIKEFDDEHIGVIYGEGTPYEDMEAEWTRVGDTITLGDEAMGGTMHIGIKYLSEYTPSRIRVSDEGGYRQSQAKLRILQWIVTADLSGEFNVRVEADNYDFPEYSATPRRFRALIARDDKSQYNMMNVRPREVKVPVRLPAELHEITIYTDNHTPLNLTGLEWFGAYNKRGRRF